MQEHKKRGRPHNKERQLNQALIIYMAKTLMRDQGKVPSIRGLARALDVDAMAIYHYFDNKNSLLEAILISLMDSIYLPPKQNDWQQSLLKLSESYLSLLKNYAGLLETLICMPEEGPISVFSERFNKVVAPLNLPEERQKKVLTLLLHFLHGQALRVTSSDADKESFREVFKVYCELLDQ